MEGSGIDVVNALRAELEKLKQKYEKLINGGGKSELVSTQYNDPEEAILGLK